MHPILARPRHLLLYLLLFTVVGALLAEVLARLAGVPRAPALLVAVPLLLLHAFTCLASWYLCRGLPLDTARTAGLIVAHVVAGGVAGTLMTLVGGGWSQMLGTLGWQAAPQVLRQGSGLLLVTGVLTFWLVVAVHYILLAAEAERRAEQQAVELRLLARESELRALKMQIDPHFLFNSLNTISALVKGAPEQARSMCIGLADFFRRSLRVGERPTIPLDEEVALLRGYLEVERVRFGDRLTIDLQVDDACADSPVPPLLLQPLVENAIRHGIAQCLDGGTIALNARLAGDQVHLVMENPYDPDTVGDVGSSSGNESPHPTRGEGIGLANTRRRLRAAFGAEGRLISERRADRFRVEITLPAGT